jgi:type IV pilus assembly protein PilA
MIVVAIIGILAAIAIPNFLRYQLRAKASEVKENVNAIFKAEEAFKNREQGGGVYSKFNTSGTLPKQLQATCEGVMGTSKIGWLPADYSDAQFIDWMVEGATYGCYSVAPSSAPAIHLTIFGESNIDGDDVYNCVFMYKATLNSTGAAATTSTGVDANCQKLGGGAVPTFATAGTAGGPAWGTPLQVDPNVF